MTLPSLIEQQLELMNLQYWHSHGGEQMAAKSCPKYGWVDKEFDECVTCKKCVESDK